MMDSVTAALSVLSIVLLIFSIVVIIINKSLEYKLNMERDDHWDCKNQNSHYDMLNARLRQEVKDAEWRARTEMEGLVEARTAELERDIIHLKDILEAKEIMIKDLSK